MLMRQLALVIQRQQWRNCLTITLTKSFLWLYPISTRDAALWLLLRPWQLSFSVHVDNAKEKASFNRGLVSKLLMDEKFINACP
eukprot:11519791-Karenia_brevis.AAC.1